MGIRIRLFPTRRLVVVGLIAVLVSSTLSCLDITVDGGPVPTPSFPIESLLLEESAFPEGWTAYEPYEPEDGFGLSTCIHYSPAPTSPGGIALHAAYIARSSEEAGDGYQVWAPFWFAEREGRGAWSVPDQLRYDSQVADRFRFACYRERGDGRRVCQAVGQYGRYMTRFHTFMHPATMPFDDLERILIAIDERMASYLAKDID
jgi:hypothetical protein